MIAILFLSVAGFLSSDGGFAQDNVIRLGGTLAETGSLTNTAKLYADGRQLAVDYINDHGGVDVDGTSYFIELVQYDDQSDADHAVSLYRQLIDEGVDFLLGPYSSGLVIPTSEVAEQFGIPMVEGGGASSTILNRGFSNVFGILPAAGNYLANAIKLFQAEAGAQTMALIYENDAFSTDVAAGTRGWAEHYGVTIIVDEVYEKGTTDFGDLIIKLKDANPDVIMGANHLAEMLAFVPQARAANVLTDMVFTIGTTSPEFLALGADAEGVFGVTPWLPTQDSSGDTFGSAPDYAQLFEQRYGFLPEYHNAAGSMEILIFKNAIEAAGSLNRDAVREQLANINFDSFYGPISFQENGQIELGQTVIQIQNGVAVGVIGDADPIFNMPN
jgi:branched-chain amino acid transport system substrate-binding protein